MSRGLQVLMFIVFVGASFAAGAIGARFTAPATAPGGWYAALPKPSWTPPAWVFAPVWSTLYLLMGIAAWLVWRRAGGFRAAAAPLALFTMQLILNAGWSILFFGLRQVGFALVEILWLWLAILAALLAFWRVSPSAGALLLPYLLWVTYAATLNWGFWRIVRAE
ncbi:MAG TPA: tryptophan-rich sensory protein [Armatimonadota bacterium]|nr:tryptophan-rich sensory protein [Armatimonadota bacterium]HOS44613.1 tryptophan-rich sensory protein [Armatimonadota bacterium]